VHEETLILTQSRSSFLEKLDPRGKLIALLAWLFCAISAPPRSWRLFAALATVLLLLLACNRHLLRRFASRFAAPLPAIIVLAAVIPLAREGRPLWQVGFLTVTREGLELAGRFAAIASLCLGAVALVWASTRQELLLSGLRGLGVPPVFTEVLGFMLRYLEVLRPELHRLIDARAARSIGPRGPGRVQSTANVVGTLFLRAHDRADRVAQAMAARGYTGRPWALRRLHLHARDLLAVTSFTATLIGLRLLLGGQT
jgi:cobalt/nickel transport system permease protein